MLARSGRKANSVGVMFCANAASFLSLDRVVNISENPTHSFPPCNGHSECRIRHYFFKDISQTRLCLNPRISKAIELCYVHFFYQPLAFLISIVCITYFLPRNRVAAGSHSYHTCIVWLLLHFFFHVWATLGVVRLSHFVEEEGARRGALRVWENSMWKMTN